MVDKVTLGQLFFKFFGFPCHFSYHQRFALVCRQGAGAVGPLVVGVSNG
jgi:hypothetical protein